MSEFKGTKGKWKATTLDDTFINSCENDALICMLEGANWVFNEKRANALLISKSPEMLEMLEIVCTELYKTDNELATKVKQLIKEATEL